MNTRSKTTILATVLAALVAGSAGVANAESYWDFRHPRRDEVLDRLHRQDARIDAKVAEGRMAPWRATRLHGEDRRVFMEEQTMAQLNGGFITPAQTIALNQELDVVSRQIGN